jgi:uncharacterized protein involved in exopolysaccharide biosynthesis
MRPDWMKGMTETRELTMEDYLAMARRRMKVVLIPLLMAPLAGFLVSYAPVFPPKYTASSMVLVEGQKVPSTYVQPVITADFTQRVQTLQSQVTSTTRLRQLVEGLGGVKPGEENTVIEDIRTNLQVTPVITSMGSATAGVAGAKKKPGSMDEPAPGFNVSYSDSNPARAQQICNQMTSEILNENLKERADVAKGTTDFLDRQVEDAKRAIDEQDAKLATFKKQYFGQLPGDVDNNMKMLMSMNSQLDATTQTLSRAQQDKAYTEHARPAGGCLEDFAIDDQPADIGSAVDPTSGAIDATASALHGRLSRCDQDQGGYCQSASQVKRDQ